MTSRLPTHLYFSGDFLQLKIDTEEMVENADYLFTQELQQLIYKTGH